MDSFVSTKTGKYGKILGVASEEFLSYAERGSDGLFCVMRHRLVSILMLSEVLGSAYTNFLHTCLLHTFLLDNLVCELRLVVEAMAIVLVHFLLPSCSALVMRPYSPNAGLLVRELLFSLVVSNRLLRLALG